MVVMIIMIMMMMMMMIIIIIIITTTAVSEKADKNGLNFRECANSIDPYVPKIKSFNVYFKTTLRLLLSLFFFWNDTCKRTDAISQIFFKFSP
jgi:hypothetical protein